MQSMEGCRPDYETSPLISIVREPDQVFGHPLITKVIVGGFELTGSLAESRESLQGDHGVVGRPTH
jgi:hypothetical protein